MLMSVICKRCEICENEKMRNEMKEILMKFLLRENIIKKFCFFFYL